MYDYFGHRLHTLRIIKFRCGTLRQKPYQMGVYCVSLQVLDMKMFGIDDKKKHSKYI